MRIKPRFEHVPCGDTRPMLKTSRSQAMEPSEPMLQIQTSQVEENQHVTAAFDHESTQMSQKLNKKRKSNIVLKQFINTYYTLLFLLGLWLANLLGLSSLALSRPAAIRNESTCAFTWDHVEKVLRSVMVYSYLFLFFACACMQTKKDSSALRHLAAGTETARGTETAQRKRRRKQVEPDPTPGQRW